jgi:hypothetical protein
MTQSGRPCRLQASGGEYCATNAAIRKAQHHEASGEHLFGSPSAHITATATINLSLGVLAILMTVIGAFGFMVGASPITDALIRYMQPLVDNLLTSSLFLTILLVTLGFLIGGAQILAGIGLTHGIAAARLSPLIVAAFHISFGLTVFLRNLSAIINRILGRYAVTGSSKSNVASQFWSHLNETA